MWMFLNNLRELTFTSLIVRLLLAMVFGGLIGLDRGRRKRAAGFRTYMLVCIGATLTMILGQYEYIMMQGEWGNLLQDMEIRTDVARIAAQVINGIGFLGAGTVIVTNIQEIKGLTTAAGLWASGCMGIAIGSGFYEAVLMGFLLIILTIKFLHLPEMMLMERAKNINIFVELESLEHMGSVLRCLRDREVEIYDVEVNRGGSAGQKNPNAVFCLRIKKGMVHTELLTMISEIEAVRSIIEV